MPTIVLATDRDLRAITSQNLDPIAALPWLYIPAEDGMMRSWGVARSDGDAPVSFYVREHPDALVAPRYHGERVDRGALLYNGAEPATEF